jgi:hypothetical protein
MRYSFGSRRGYRNWKELARALDEEEENGLYRFYHGSYKVFYLQDPVQRSIRSY